MQISTKVQNLKIRFLKCVVYMKHAKNQEPLDFISTNVSAYYIIKLVKTRLYKSWLYLFSIKKNKISFFKELEKCKQLSII